QEDKFWGKGLAGRVTGCLQNHQSLAALGQRLGEDNPHTRIEGQTTTGQVTGHENHDAIKTRSVSILSSFRCCRQPLNLMGDPAQCMLDQQDFFSHLVSAAHEL
ncbi:hypothetical protein BaRGS_00008154, partial [Batillaria attramentaria]